MVGARTQPLLSCITIARMNRASIPVELATDWIADDISEISESELSATPNCEQEVDITPWLAANMVSKSGTQSLIAGHPSAVSPSPPNSAYEVALSRPSKK